MSVKAFELVPAIEREQLIGDKSSNTSIECIECCNDDFLIGGSDGSIIKYKLNEDVDSTGRATVTAKKTMIKFLPQKKPVNELRCASAIERLLVLTDYSLIILNLESLEVLSATSGYLRIIKNVAAFCLNENPVSDDPFVVFICAAMHRKKTIQLFSLTEDKLAPLFEKSLVDFPLKVAWDRNFICAALTNQYVMITIEKNVGVASPTTGGSGARVQELIPYQAEQTNPVVKRVAKEEFLIAGPAALGIFVTSEGISQRPPLPWSKQLYSVAFSHPYVLALSKDLVTVHSILDLSQKQAISFIGGVVLGDFDGKIFIASPREIYSLLPVSWEKQVQGLLEDGRVDEALDLAQNSRSPSSASSSGLSVLNRVRLKAGFFRFKDMKFDDAKQLFCEGELDVCELISLFPLLLPADSDFSRSVPPLHEIADISQVAKNDLKMMTAYMKFLMEYLEAMRPAVHTNNPRAREINTALIKLYVQSERPDKVQILSQLLVEVTIDQITESDANLDYIGCEEWLKACGYHHATAMLAQNRGNHEAALDIWVQLVDGRLKDDDFQGLEFVIDQICLVPNSHLVMRFSDWALTHDQILAVRIFTSRFDTAISAGSDIDDAFKPSIVIKRLHNRYPKALINYLEHLIFNKKMDNEEFHTHLALLYYETLTELKSIETEETELIKCKFRQLLQSSSTLRLQLLLGKLKNQKGFEYEEALLHSKVGDYSSALCIFVHRLKDLEGAERFCTEFSSGSSDPERLKAKLVTQLLNVYLDPALSPSESGLLAGPAVKLLNGHDTFSTPGSAKSILNSLPDNWSVALLAPFLLRTLRTSVHEQRMGHIGRFLAAGQAEEAGAELSNLKHKTRTDLSVESVCSVCGDLLVSFDENLSKGKSEFHWYPNGVVTHAKCGSRDRRTCPVTGNSFPPF